MSPINASLLSRMPLNALRLCGLGGLLAMSSGIGAAGCGAKQSGSEPTTQWEDVAAATGPGAVRVVNASERSVTRLWFSPSHVEGLWPGTTPEGFATLAPGSAYEQTIPMGWWDVWVEAADGADALLYRTWFGNNAPTVFTITESWWQLGDWISEEIEEPAPQP